VSTTYRCDLCGKKPSHPEFRSLISVMVSAHPDLGPPEGTDLPRYAIADVCTDCLAKPVSEVIAVMGKRERKITKMTKRAKEARSA
jgi:hypothetical protein